MEDLDPEFLAWLAGFWEGEGSLSICNHPNGGYRLSICQKSREPLDLIKDRVGGAVRRKERNREIHAWFLDRKLKIIDLLERLIPHLKFRREEVNSKLEEMKKTGSRHTAYSPWEIAFIEDNFPELDDRIMAKKLGRSLDGLQQFRLKKLGFSRIKRNEELQSVDQVPQGPRTRSIQDNR